MQPLRLDTRAGAPRSVLCLGAHADDIEIGCGGTLLKLLERAPDLECRWVVFSATAARRREALASAARFLGEESDKRVVIEDFRDGFLPYQGVAVKEAFERLKAEFRPDLIFTHCRHDLHQDHRLVSELTAQTFRDHLVLEYEIPKYDGDLGAPSAYVHLDEKHVALKVEILLETFASQRDRPWFDAETFRALLRLRGVESRAPSRYAEAFYVRKLVLETG